MASQTGTTRVESGSGRVRNPPGAGGTVPRRELIEMLTAAARVTLVSAPPGSGKTVLLRSWIEAAAIGNCVAQVSVRRDEHDGPRFWTEILDALRATEPAAALVRPLTAAPTFDGWAVVEALLDDLAPLQNPLWLVIDDLHELRAEEALRQLQLLILRAPATVRFVLSSRHDLRLGLHRLRLAGELTEVRREDLRFTFAECRALMEGAGIEVSDSSLAALVDRTEGWAAGLRLAALSLARHPDPGQFAAALSGTERTIAEYLFAEVLDRQPDDVKRLLLRTSILDQVNEELAELLSGTDGGERILQQLEDENAFVVSLDPGRTWFRYHHLFADLLRLELRHAEPHVAASLHATASDWYAARGMVVEAISHAQAAQDWSRALRLLFEHWFGLELDGKAGTAHELLLRFPADRGITDPELTALRAADQLSTGSLEAAERHLAQATARGRSLPQDRVRRYELTLSILRMSLARRRANVAAVTAEAQTILSHEDLLDDGDHDIGDDLRGLALISLGVGAVWSMRIEAAALALERAITLARRVNRPFLEVTALAYCAILGCLQSSERGRQLSRQTIDLAQRHGWSSEPVVAAAYGALGATLTWEGQLAEAEPWLERAEHALRPQLFPAIALLVHHVRGQFELANGRDERALAAFERVNQLNDLLVAPMEIAMARRGLMMQALVRLGAIKQATKLLAGLDERERDDWRTRISLAAFRLALGDAEGAAVALRPVVQEPGALHRVFAVEALLLEAIARDTLGHADAATAALEQALDVAEPDTVRWPFLVHRAAALLQRHRKARTAHAAFVSDVLDLLAGQRPLDPRERLIEPLTESETRVLRYLPTNLTAPEIAAELHVTTNTVKTHLRHLYEKLDVHSRTAAVVKARALGVVASSARGG